jgi:hypothetical protein
MRKFFVILGSVVIAVALAFFAVTSPWVMEKSIEWTCKEPTERCIVRMRGMGHVWSHKDNLDRAAHWYRLAAEAGDPAAMFHLGWTFEGHGMGDIKSFIAALAKARGADDADDQATEEPRLSRQSFESAADWYRRAADAGFAPAMNNLGDLYGLGRLGKSDPQTAFQWHLAAARAGNPVGAFNVSLAYREGRGVARDIAEADRWARWSPVRFQDRDLSNPTLARTHFFGDTLAEPMRHKLQAVARSGPPAYAVLELKPMKPDPRLPTFSDVQRRATEGKSQ